MTGGVRVKLSRNAGGSYTEIPGLETVTAAASNTEYWNPVTGPGTTQARIRIESIDFPNTFDELPVPTACLVYTAAEWCSLNRPAGFAQMVEQEIVWVYVQDQQ